MRTTIEEDQLKNKTQQGKVANAVNRRVREKATNRLTALSGHQPEPNRGQGSDRKPATPKSHVTGPRQWQTEAAMTPERKAEAKQKATYHQHLGAIAKLAGVTNAAKKHERLEKRYSRVAEALNKKLMKKLVDASDQANNKTAAMYTNVGEFNRNVAFESVLSAGSKGKLPYSLTVHYEVMHPDYGNRGDRFHQTSNHRTKAGAEKRLKQHHHNMKGVGGYRIVDHEIKSNLDEAKNQNRETSGRYTLGMHHRCTCGHTLGEHGNPDIAPSKRACMHESGCKCEGFKKDKKQMFKEWLEEAREKHTHLGTCQACGRQQAHESRAGGVVAKHGYKVEHGFFNGTCPGSGHKPLEHEHKFTDYVISHMKEQAKSAREESAAAKAGHHNPHIHSHDEEVHDEHGKPKRDKYLRKITKPVHKPYSESTPEAKARYHAHLEQHARHSEAHARELEKLKKDVHGKPLTPAHHHPEVVAKRAEVKQARTANADKKRELYHLGHEFDKAHHELQKHYLALPHHERTEAKTNVYYGPQFHHWSAKHSEAAKKEFPAAHHIINHIDSLAARRKELTKKEERQMQVDTSINLLDEGREHQHTHQVTYSEKGVPGHQYMHVTADDRSHAIEQAKDAYPHAKIHKVEKLSVKEARESEYTANRHMTSTAASTRKPGHYLMKHGSPMHSEPHVSPQHALSAYHALPDKTGVKIQHVREDFTLGETPVKTLAELSKKTTRKYMAKAIDSVRGGNTSLKRAEGILRANEKLTGKKHGVKEEVVDEIAMGAGSMGDPGAVQNPTSNFASQLDQWKKRFKLHIKKPIMRRRMPKVMGLGESQIEPTAQEILDDEGIPPSAISTVELGVVPRDKLERHFHDVRDGQTKKIGPGGVDEETDQYSHHHSRRSFLSRATRLGYATLPERDHKGKPTGNIKAVHPAHGFHTGQWTHQSQYGWVSKPHHEWSK